MRRALAVLALLALALGAVAADASVRLRRSRSFVGGFSTWAVAGGQLRPLYVFTYGQSNSIGSSGGGLPVSITDGSPGAAPYNAQEYRTSAFASAYSNTGAADTEVVCYGAMNQLNYLALDEGVPTLGAACQTGGVGSQTYAQLADGTGNWTTQWNEARALYNGYAAEFPDASGTPLVLVIWLQGESDQVSGTTRAQYVTNLLDLHGDVCDELQAAPFSLSACPAIHMVPYGAATRLGAGTTTLGESSEIVMAHYEACRDYPTQFVCAHPGYASAYTVSNEHYSGAGHRINGAQIARVFRHVSVLADGWTFFRPDAGNISCVDNVVTIPLEGGIGTGLAIDTTNVALRPHLGFEYYDTQSDMPTILTATVSSATGTAILTLNRNCSAGFGARVRYAYSGVPASSSGASAQGGTGGNIRRRGNGETPYYGSELLYDWLTPFDEPVNTITGMVDDPPIVSDTGIGIRTTASTGWATTRSTTVADNTTDMTVSAWVYITSFAANQVIAESWQSTNARRWSMRTVATGGLTFFLSANGTTLSYSCTTNTSIVATSAWQHVGFRLDSGVFTPFINGATTTCASTTGSVPANLATTPATAWTPISVGNSNAGGANLPGMVSHVAVWGGLALDATRIAALYDSTPVPTPVDVRSQNPSHYWPLGGTLEDFGVASPRPLLPYATTDQHVETGSLFSTADSLGTFSATNILDGATSWTARLDVLVQTPAQNGTFLDRDTAASDQRQLHLGLNTSRQPVVGIATSLTEGGGEWRTDATRDECVATALTAGTRYRIAIVYNGPGATNADRLRVFASTLTEATGGDGRTRITVGTPTELTCTFLGTIPASMTTPTTAAWTVGRRASGTTSTGLRSVTMNGNGIVIWRGVATDADEQVPEILRALDPYATSLGAPVAMWRFKGVNVHEVVTQGAGTMTGTALGAAFVTPAELRDGTADFDGTWAAIGRMTPAPSPNPAAFTPWVISEGVFSNFNDARTVYGFDGTIANTNPTTSLVRVDQTWSTPAAGGITLGMDVGNAASYLFDIQDGFEWQGSLANLASGIPTNTAGGLIFNRGLSGFPFTDPALQNNTLLFGVTTDTAATAADDISCIAVSAAGTRTTVTLDGIRTDNRLDVVVYAPPGGAYVRARFRDTVTNVQATCTLTTNLPTLPLGFITHATPMTSGGTVNMVVGPAVWGRGVTGGITAPQLPQAFTGVTVPTWMASIEPPDLRQFMIAMVTAQANPYSFGYGPDGAGGVTGMYGTTEMAPTGLSWWTLAPTTSNGTDGTYGDYIRFVSGTVANQPAMLTTIPPTVTGAAGRTMMADRGFFAHYRGRRSGATADDARGVILGVTAGDFGDPAAEVSTFPGVAFEYDSTDATADGIFLHHGVAIGGTTRVSLASAGGVRTDGAVYEAMIGAERGGGRFGVVLYRVDTGVIVYDGWLTTNIPADGDTLFVETNASPCDVGTCTTQTHDVFFLRGHSRDPRGDAN